MKTRTTHIRRPLSTIGSVLFLLFSTSLLWAQPVDGYTLEGKILNNATNKPVDFATIIVQEATIKTYSAADGSYTLTIPDAGEYTIIVRSTGLRPLTTKIIINRNIRRNFYLGTGRIKSSAITITADRDIQKISRHTMTAQELKEVPGSFGDSISALTSLPGVVRTGGFFGPLVIRGASSARNNYFIDDIPISNPMHFGGLHSVINNNMMREIDLYASAFPAQFGSASAAVININTADDVKEFSGYTDFNILSISTLFQAPILKDQFGENFIAGPAYDKTSTGTENVGYLIASARYATFKFGFATTELLSKATRLYDFESVEYIPEYFDYQLKCKYYLNNSHALTLLFFGSGDYFRISGEDVDLDESVDPYFEDFQYKTDSYFHNQGIYYTYQPSKKFKNTLLAYSALRESYQYASIDNANAAEWIKDFNVRSYPYNFGLKNKNKFAWWNNYAELRTGLAYSLYYFRAQGKTIVPAGEAENIDPTDESLFLIRNLDEHIVNHVLSAYIENKFTYKGLTFTPGFRTDYLERTQQATWDPRGMLSYEFPTETTISCASGKYSYHLQTNPNLFDTNPNIAAYDEDDGAIPEKALHNVIGIEQKIQQLYTIRVEGFYNYFYDQAEVYGHTTADGRELDILYSGKIRTRGIEIMLRKDTRKNQDGLFGWLSYTLSKSEEKTGLPTEAGYDDVAENKVGDEHGDEWVNFDYDQRHSFKIVLGYTFGNHTLSCKFQYYSSYPYTPITGAEKDANYSDPDDPSRERYTPLYGYRNSNYYAPTHRLDIRYSYKIRHSWGYISWYIEVLNVYNNKAESEQWDYRYDYSASNPTTETSDEDFGILPNFGVEVKF